MNALTKKDLQDVMDKDIYYAIPVSIVKWVLSLDLKSSEQICLERIISHIIIQHGKDVRISHTYLQSLSNLSKKTVARALLVLENKNIITRKDTNDDGTLINVLIPKSVKSDVHIRFKNKCENPKGKENIKSPQEKDQQSNNEKIVITIKEKQTELEKLKSTITIDESLSPRQRLALMNNSNIDTCRINRLEDEIRDLKSKIRSKDFQTVKMKPKTKRMTLKHPLRAIPFTALKELKESLKKMRVTLVDDVFNQVAWNIRFGWYRQKSWSTKHCINHALKLIKRNVWTTPSNYKVEQIIGLTKFVENN